MRYQNCPLFHLQSKKKLSYLLKAPLHNLLNVDKFYLSDSFKQDGRILTNPRLQLKKILSTIVTYLIQIGVPQFEFGGIPQQSALKNVKLHVGNGYILRTDIQHFFPNTDYSNVYNFFRLKLMMSIDCATILAHLTTENVLSNHRSLPQGYPTSPLLSLYCYIDLFNTLSEFANKHSLILSVYYDDITMSSTQFIPYPLLHQVREIIHKYGFNAHPRKTKLIKVYKPIRKIKITGILVNKNGLSVPKSLFQKLHKSIVVMSSALKEPDKITNNDKYKIVHQVRGRVASIQVINDSYNFQGYLDHARQLEKMMSKDYLFQKERGII